MFIKNNELKKIVGEKIFEELFLTKELFKLLKEKEKKLNIIRLSELRKTLTDNEWALMNSFRNPYTKLKLIEILKNNTYGYQFDTTMKIDNQLIEVVIVFVYSPKTGYLKIMTPFEYENNYVPIRTLRNFI